MIVGMTPTYLSVSIGKKWVKQRNRTLYGLIEMENREAIEAITIALNVLTQIICFVGILGSNVVLIMALREKTRWRQTATGAAKLKSSSKPAAAGNFSAKAVVGEPAAVDDAASRSATLAVGDCLATQAPARPTQGDPSAKAGHQLGKRSISAISDAYFDTSWRGDISWYLDYD